jgi:hypothetical protein
MCDQNATNAFLGSDPCTAKYAKLRLYPEMAGFTGPVFSLASLLGNKSSTAKHKMLKMSRKQRFGVAAATSWAVLHLCGSPWFNGVFDKKDILISKYGKAKADTTSVNSPLLSYVFDEESQQAPPSANATQSPVDTFQSSQIRNRTLFALGILLIELCLNHPFEDIRKQWAGQNHASTSASAGDDLSIDSASAATAADEPPLFGLSIADDYEIANAQADNVYLEAGDSYGYAVQRCLRCEFAGRDVTKNFEFAQFRRHFFNGVVAPVQATFAMLPGSCAAL